MKKSKTNSTENYYFYSREKSLYIAWMCFRNVNKFQLIRGEVSDPVTQCSEEIRPYFFLILGLQIFFQNIKVGGGKKIKIKITKNNFII